MAKNSPFKTRNNDIYGMFLFSTLDALLDQSMEEALEDLDLPEDVKQVLIFEEGEWTKVTTISKEIMDDTYRY